MPTNFPTAVDSFPTAATLAGHNLSTDPHSTLHGNLGDAVLAVETYVRGQVFNVKAYGAVGDGVATDTTAIQAAVTAAVAVHGVVFFPAGTYLCGALTTLTSSGLTIRGAGRYATTIKGTATTWLTFDTFSVAPTQHGAYDTLTISDLTLDGQQTGTAEGSRTRRAITDNGSGNIYLQNMTIIGWQYGLKANYGSDFDRVDAVQFLHCDVGAYLAWGSDQGVWTGVEFYHCVEGMVIDGVILLTLETCAFVDCKTICFQYEFLATPRNGVTTPTNTGGSLNNGKIILENCWFESITRTPTNGFVRTYSDSNTAYPQGMEVRSPFWSPSSAATVAFWNFETGRHMILADLAVHNSQGLCAVQRGTNAHYMLQQRTFTGEGWTPIPWWSNQDNTCRGEGRVGDVTTFTSLDTTPSVAVNADQYGASSHEVFKATNGGATSITTFDDGYAGQQITVICTNGNTTFVNGTPLKTRTGANVTAAANTAYSFVYDGTTWWASA